MSFQLVYGDHDFCLPLSFEIDSEERLIALISNADPGSTSHRNLSVRITDAITAAIEFTVIRPTEKQLKYAIGIAQELNLALPADALQHRDAMAIFLSRHADTYRRRRGPVSDDGLSTKGGSMQSTAKI
ncbi:MAG: hypothetical protein E6R07_07545 [Nevskiaceae bacterium]|nr:MAG: hypothetical protein E6R07_07545 [Nevskiaceae bacterium]